MMSCPTGESWLWADWPAPEHVHAGITTRLGGFSQPPFDSLNIARHVGDDAENVEKNRQKIVRQLCLNSEPVWLNQIHGNRIISVNDPPEFRYADGSTTTKRNIVCAVMTADCVPLLICDRQGEKIAVVHAGWRGILKGVIENAVAEFSDPEAMLVWVGPCISRQFYEIAEDVYSQCIYYNALFKQVFEPTGRGRWYCDLKQLVKIILKSAGINLIYECNLCTYERTDMFYSCRRNRITGRTATMIWIE